MYIQIRRNMEQRGRTKCAEKVTFKNVKLATGWLQRTGKTDILKAYCCPHCARWHLTSDLAR